MTYRWPGGPPDHDRRKGLTLAVGSFPFARPTAIFGLGTLGTGKPGYLNRSQRPDGSQGVSFVPDQFDVSLEDSDLLGEVELTTNLIIAASETDEHLTKAEIDEILGVSPGPSA